MFEKINLQGGRITYNDFTIDFNKPLHEQVFRLDQDLLQITFGDEEYVIDVGWYPELDIKGHLLIQVIHESWWFDPIFKKKIAYNKLQTFFPVLDEAISFVADKIRNPVPPDPRSVAFIEQLTLFEGKVRFNRFKIDPKLSFEEQKSEYKNHLFLVEYGEKYSVALAWLPEYDPEGFFVIDACYNGDWEDPMFEKKTRDVNQIPQYINEAIEFVEREMQKPEERTIS